MTEGRTVKGVGFTPRLVAVIASPADLTRALRLRHQPEFFEVRLDALFPLSVATEHEIARLPRPLLITARHPAEGGRNDLSAAQRRHLLQRFLPHAAAIDIELRSAAQMRSLLATADEQNVRRILSVHALDRMPSPRELERIVERALAFPRSTLKIVVRTETERDLAQLLAFFDEYKTRLPLSAMGVGKLGRASRIALLRCGSVLNYAHLGRATLAGQLSFAEARRFSSAR